MKISEMTNEQATNALVRLVVPVGNLCEDQTLMDMFQTYSEMQNAPFVQTVGKLIPQFVLYLLKSHKEDLYEIVGALTDQPAKKVAGMNFIQTTKVIKDSYDEVLATFFTSSVTPTKGSEEKSSSALSDTATTE